MSDAEITDLIVKTAEAISIMSPKEQLAFIRGLKSSLLERHAKELEAHSMRSEELKGLMADIKTA